MALDDREVPGQPGESPGVPDPSPSDPPPPPIDYDLDVYGTGTGPKGKLAAEAIGRFENTPKSGGGGGGEDASGGVDRGGSGQGRLTSPGGASYQGQSADDWMAAMLRKMAENPTRYDAKTMEQLTARNLAARDRAKRTGIQGVQEELAARGMFRSGGARTRGGISYRDVIAGAERDFASRSQALRIEKINADYNDKVDALKMAQTNLDSARDWWYKQEMTGIERDRIQAQLSLGYAAMDNALGIARLQRQTALDLANMGAALTE